MNKKHDLVIVITLITTITFAILLCLQLVCFKVGISIIGICITIAFGRLKLIMQNDLIFKDLFEYFNHKYDEKFNDKLNEFVKKNKLEKEDKDLIIDYINMCAEQYLWYRKGRIDPYVWKSWVKGMKHFLFNGGEIKEVYQLEKEKHKGSYYGFMEYMDKTRLK